MIYSFPQIQKIIKDNPKKEKLAKARETAKKLRRHVMGIGHREGIEQHEYFASAEIFKVQKKLAVSNVDLFARVLGQEDMIFSTKGGSTNFNLAEAKETALNAILDKVTQGMSLRKWMQQVALSVFRTDPMGIIFMEIDSVAVDANGNMKTPTCYPTYKSTEDIFDYDCTGRQLEYVAFQLTIADCNNFGITDTQHDNRTVSDKSQYYRFVDDEKDIIVKYADNEVVIAANITQKNPIANIFKKVPGFITSDIVVFDDLKSFQSPLYKTIELADVFLEDRSVRNLQKKYHGFAKAIEPLINCPVCAGEKIVEGNPCKACTPANSTKPTGFKLLTTVADVTRFPLAMFGKDSAAGFDFKKTFGYATPDIESWNKQDTSIYEQYVTIYETYWGTRPGKQGFNTSNKGSGNLSNPDKTATEVDADLKPIYSQLNKMADWAETTESMIADFIGQYWYPELYKKATIVYGRNYILKTPEELFEDYQNILQKGGPDFSKDEALQNFYQAKYQTNPMQMQKFLKKMKVEPFPHDTIDKVEASQIIKFEDKVAKRYFGEWADTLPDNSWITVDVKTLKTQLITYIATKQITEPNPQPVLN